MRQPKNNVLDASERKRLTQMTQYERQAWEKGLSPVAGIDEAGRGPLAGPVVAAACIIPEGRLLKGVNDSKKLTPLERRKLFDIYTNDSTIEYAVGIVDHEEIDRINIFQATIVAMLKAVDKLPSTPKILLVDGLQLPHQDIPALKIIKGDALSQSIALASIIAKVTRDEMMMHYHEQWPEYGFCDHKGYGTEKHRLAIRLKGPSPIQRKTFKLKTADHE